MRTLQATITRRTEHESASGIAAGPRALVAYDLKRP